MSIRKSAQGMLATLLKGKENLASTFPSVGNCSDLSDQAFPRIGEQACAATQALQW
jgi:hypothetical protein